MNLCIMDTESLYYQGPTEHLAISFKRKGCLLGVTTLNLFSVHAVNTFRGDTTCQFIVLQLLSYLLLPYNQWLLTINTGYIGDLNSEHLNKGYI